MRHRHRTAVIQAQPKAGELEAYIYERAARQLQMVGDGLAWQCFGYDRRVILTLCRNASPGPMYGKEGLPYELERIQELWENDGHFALHHDLTNCLRIADLTEFTGAGIWLREIKRKPHTEKAQMDRAQAAVDALMHGGELPGPRRGARLLQLTELYVTNLAQLGELIQIAKERGCAGTALSQGRALVASSLPACLRRWGADHAEQGRVLAATLCGPKSSSTSCDQAIFVDQATDASLLPDATLAEVDWLG